MYYTENINVISSRLSSAKNFQKKLHHNSMNKFTKNIYNLENGDFLFMSTYIIHTV